MSYLRAFWRWLTSMRTALILLLVLAVAAVPGSIWPQRLVSPTDVNTWIANHPKAGPWLDRFYLFDVYASPWFSAVYTLLFISLVGCLIPRLRQHLTNIIRKPPAAPSRMQRLPHHATGALPTEPAQAAVTVRAGLKSQRWRTVTRTHDDQTITISAEKGYLKETGNLVFHFALLALLVGVAAGSWFGWHANRLAVAGEGFCASPQEFDEYHLGSRVDAGTITPFCLTLDDFQANYLTNGQPTAYNASVTYQTSPDTPPQTYDLRVNHPLRFDGDSVYLLGHGYAMSLTVTDRYGHTENETVPFLPQDGMLTSTGVAKFQYANYSADATPFENLANQLGFAGVFMPTLPDDPSVGRSAFPAENDPGLVLVAYQGNLGLGTGAPQSVYDLDHDEIASGALKQVGQQMMRPGDSWTLPDGSVVQFTDVQQWITISVRHDPGQRIMLVGAICLLAGLMTSLAGRRRRVWVRISPSAGGGSLISFGGLPRHEYPGFVGEFSRVTALAPNSDPGPDPDPDLGPDPDLVTTEKET